LVSPERFRRGLHYLLVGIPYIIAFFITPRAAYRFLLCVDDLLCGRTTRCFQAFILAGSRTTSPRKKAEGQAQRVSKKLIH